MFRSFLTLALACCIALPAIAQDDRLDDLTFEEEEVKETNERYFAFGFGPIANLAFVNVDAINARATALGLDNVSAPVIQAGVEVFAPVGVVDNLRVGFSWVSGSLTSSKDLAPGSSPTIVQPVKRTLEYSIGSRAVFFDYALLPGKAFNILPGVGFGWSTQTLTTFQGPTSVAYNPNDGISVAPSEFHELNRSVLSVVPRVNFEYKVSTFVSVRLNAAYTLQFSASDWQGNRTSVVTGVPNELNVNSLNAQLGLFLGLFN